MKKHKINWRIWFFLILLSGVLLFGTRVVFMLFGGDITYALEFAFVLTVGSALSLVLITYLISVFTIILLFVKHKGCGLAITDEGIENTFVFVNLFAFIIVLPVRRIPWEAITYYDTDSETPYIRIDTKQTEAGFLAKIILKILGYGFCNGFVKPDITRDDIKRYEYRFKVQSIAL